MKRFAQTCDAIATHPGKLDKIEILAEYLRTLDERDLIPATRFFTGNPFGARDERTLAVGGRIIIDAARAVWGVTDVELGAGYRDTGDLGAALGRYARAPMDLAFFSETLAPATLYELFEQIAAASGKAAGRKRLALCERILRACTERLEATYVIKIMTGDLRIGLREGLVIDAVAKAFDCAAYDVRRATMAAGDIGEVAAAAKQRRLAQIRVSYGSPVGFMLATPLQYGSEYKDLASGEWIAEPKYDGIRAQIHKYGDRVRIFSRTLNDVTHSYPEVAQAAAEIRHDVMLDGEIVARRDGEVMPFRYLQARLQRKTVDERLLEDVPVAFMAFDILALNDVFLIDEPLAQRKAELAAEIRSKDALVVTPQSPLAMPIDAEVLHDAFESARGERHEGLMLKRLDSPYHPGRRGKWWLKLKRELSTLDVVIVAVEWGHGKRAKVLSDYTFAVRGDDGELQTIGKAYSGLTDAEIAENTGWFLEHQKGRDGYRIRVEPSRVIEVAFDIIQPSDLHDSGFSLRFPRIVRMRDDKPASEADTIERVREIYGEMLEREGVHR
ncbi:MAG: ATP-dependent DNA ligase [Candidatus Eremiobacteraeota bacterium]|nr:ATP-dependent DNA ligase [Candidatus Eremiobacteraeota bacterium]